MAMLARLEGYSKAHGSCSVPTNCKQNPTLGRWVAAQRHRRKIGLLTSEQIAALDRLGFVWSPTEKSWDSLYAQLAEFQKKRGNCDVPTKWPHNIVLADWVQRQRLSKKKGRLGAARVRQLNGIGFTWAIYKGGQGKREAREARPAPAAVRRASEERLYCLRIGVYVQYDGKGRMPPGLQSYVSSHGGEFPPYIPLPTRSVVFSSGDTWGSRKKLRWKGKGPIPREVLAFVGDHGHLPQYD